MWRPSEASLIAAAKSGDGAAFADLLQGMYIDAFRMAYAFLQDRHEAEDAVQEAAFKAWRRLHQLRPAAPMRPWFLGIVANACRSRVRVRWWTEIRMDRLPETQADPDLAGNLDVRRAVARLGYNQRLIVILRFYLDLPYDEVGAALGISPKAARSRAERALDRLRGELRPMEAFS